MPHGVRSLKDGLQEHFDWATDPRPRIGTGLSFFDGPTGGGIAQEELAMIMACSSVGKTAIGLNIARANPETPTLFFSLEMSWRMLAARLVAMETGMSTQAFEKHLKSGQVPSKVLEVVEKYPLLYCDDTPDISIPKMGDAMDKATEIMGVRPKLVIMDYLELIAGGGGTNGTEQVDKIARKIRSWTRHEGVATFVLHQVGKGDGGPGADPLSLTDGRYGGHTPMDYVIGAYAPRLQKGISLEQFHRVKDEVYLQLLKNRNGEASPPGIRHRLDAVNLRLSEWRDTPWALPTFAPPMDNYVHEDLYHELELVDS